MDWSDFTPGTDSALDFRARNPAPAAPTKPSFWGQVAEFVAAPAKGLGQGAQQSLRIANRAAPTMAGNPLAMSASEQEELLQESGITSEAQDQALRRGIDALKPDPITSTTASAILQDASRLLGKVGAYALAGGPVGAAVGTGLDEAGTGFLEMRDKGVDTATAAKVGAVRGVTTGIGVALPVAGKTVAQTVGLVVAGGPASYMTEQATTRAILENAAYPHLASEYDPLDAVGLGVATIVPGVVGAVAHRVRAKARPVEALLESNPEVLDAALAAHRNDVAERGTLADPASMPARQQHAEALAAATRALDEGAPVRVNPLEVDPARAQAVIDEVRARALDLEAAELRQVDGEPLDAVGPFVDRDPTSGPRLPADDIEPAGLPVEPFAIPQQAESDPIARARQLAAERPDMPVYMDETGEQLTAAQLMESVSEDAARNKTDALAFRAAVECFLGG